MSEDDRFSKRMPKGYKSAYHFAAKGHSDSGVARALAAGIARHMKEGGFVLDALAPMLAALEKSLLDAANRAGELFNPIDDIRVNFHYTVETIAIKHALGDSTRILCEVSQHTFGRLLLQPDVTRADIQKAFCEELTRTLAGHWCFAVACKGVTAREEIMRRNQRDMLDQSMFEKRVCDKVVSVVENLIKQALNSPDGKPKRTPLLPKRVERFSLAEMDQLLSEVQSS
jgi:hypothetical protein